MRLRRPIAFILSAAVAASALTGCDSFSGHAAAAANSAQVQQLIEFIADLGLERDLRQALQKGGDLRQALLTLLGLESAVNFNVDGLTSARPGQHAVQVWEVTAQSAEDAAALAASQIRAVLEQLKSSGVTEGRIGMVEVDGKYYVVVDVEVTEENTFEPAKPVSDDDDDGGKDDSEDDDDGGKDDSEDDTIPGVTVENDLLIVDVAKLELNEDDINADAIINTINKQAETEYDRNDIVELDLRDCEGLESIGKPDVYPGAFKGCEKLTTVTLPSSVTTIGSFAFQGCTSLTNINLSACTSLDSIGDYAFYSCDGLTSIDLSACTSLDSIGRHAFRYCDSLEEINLGGCTSLDTIDIGAFANSGLTSITLPAGLQNIGYRAFYYCTGLTDITFYNVPKIGTGAFEGVITGRDPSEKLTIYCPSSCSIEELKKQLEIGGLVEENYDLDATLSPAAYPLGF